MGLASQDDVLQAESEGGRKDFLGVRCANGDDAVGVEDAALEEVDAAKAFEFLWVPEELRQAR